MTYIERRNYRQYNTAGIIDSNYSVIGLGSGGALAMTLPDPNNYQDGTVLNIVATTAQAHTVTNTTGFNAGSTASDVATFGGAIGDSMSVIALSGVWYVLNLRNVTLG